MDKEFMEAIENKDLEAYKRLINFESLTDFEKDWRLMEFENMTEEKIKDPNIFLAVRMGKMFNLARKHGIDPLKPVEQVLENKKSETKNFTTMFDCYINLSSHSKRFASHFLRQQITDYFFQNDNGSGVFAMFDNEGKCVYVSYSGNVKRALQSFCNATSKIAEHHADIKQIGIKFLDDGLYKAKHQYIEQLKPILQSNTKITRDEIKVK
jgi:hypothetical protein